MTKMQALITACLTLTAASGIAHEHAVGAREKLGKVHFAISCKAVTQDNFNRAVALLHSFQFRRAIEGFDAVLNQDPSCGIAYWGISLSDWSNPFAAGLKDKNQLRMGRDFADRGKLAGAKTARERGYIAAVSALYDDVDNRSQHMRVLAYRDAMRELSAQYPEDHEARIFYALALAASEDLGDKTYASRLEAGAILEELFKEEPTHPGLAHYIIHTYDVPALAQRGLVAARRYATIAPDAPHALHMPSHTFTRTGNWQESIDSNIAAAAAARRAGETAEELHATDYETYAYLQLGKDEAAERIVTSLPEIASRFDPKVVIGGAGGPSVGYFALAAIPARHALERGNWQEASTLVVRETPFPYTDAMTWFARGLGDARSGRAEAAEKSADALEQIREHLVKSGEGYWARQVEIQETTVRAWAALARDHSGEALAQMAAAAVLEDGTEKSAITPGPLAPARELFGEMLLQTNAPARALAEFEATLIKEPRRLRSLLGAAHAAQLADDRPASEHYLAQLVTVLALADNPGRPEMVDARRASAP